MVLLQLKSNKLKVDLLTPAYILSCNWRGEVSTVTRGVGSVASYCGCPKFDCINKIFVLRYGIYMRRHNFFVSGNSKTLIKSDLAYKINKSGYLVQLNYQKSKKVPNKSKRKKIAIIWILFRFGTPFLLTKPLFLEVISIFTKLCQQNELNKYK